ncbi:hypothetical protein [Daejeonella lutea]|uniref:Cache domain-containing protein n=1 Tax=Daejeonella lutea TaxID=572036 RepID=A0A1T5ANL4_9SPHI|nr:hypothetical protein [Daejeonella lutea]SKB36449.1 hypothetical protein SAMN05661099_0890 [Daejeonella lutea]
MKNENEEINRADNSIKNSDSQDKKTIRFIVIISLGLIAGLWLWKSYQINNISEKALSRETQLTHSAQKQLFNSHEEHLKLLVKPMIWALRSQMIQGNIEQVNMYLNDMVKEKNFQRIAVADNKGIIISSTNKKDEGSPISVFASVASLPSNETMSQNIGDSIIIITSPVMGFNSRLGTVAIRFAVPPAKF